MLNIHVCTFKIIADHENGNVLTRIQRLEREISMQTTNVDDNVSQDGRFCKQAVILAQKVPCIKCLNCGMFVYKEDET